MAVLLTIDAFRSAIGDVNANLTDVQCETILANSVTVNDAIADGLRALGVYKSGGVVTIEDVVTIDNSKAGDAYLTMAKAIEMRGANNMTSATGTLCAPRVTGVSVEAMNSVRSNPDRPPCVYDGLMDNIADGEV